MIEHRTRVRVRYAETDQMKFAHHSAYIVWFEMARIELMRGIAIDYAGMEKQGYLLPVLEIKAGFKLPARFDDQLEIVTLVENPPRARLKFEYRVFNKKMQMICDGYSAHAFMNAREKAVKPPKFFLEAFKRYC